MSDDIQFISVVDDLQVLFFETIEGSSPRTLRIVGRGGFTSAQRVLVNDFGVDTFELVSDKVLLAPVPSFISLPDNEIDVAVIASALTNTRRVRLLFAPTLRTKTVSGLQKLVQQVVKELISNVASNRFDPASGGGLLDGLGETLNPAGKERISNTVAQAVTQTRDLFLSSQTTERNLASSERLLDMSLRGVGFEVNRAVATIRMTTYAGASLDVPLVL